MKSSPQEVTSERNMKMAIYNPKSLKAEEFINNEEILATIEYAEQNKNNVELIDSILEKAKPIKVGNGYQCTGLTHRDAAVLLACDMPEKVSQKASNTRKHKSRLI